MLPPNLARALAKGTWSTESLMQVLNNDDLHGYVTLTNASA